MVSPELLRRYPFFAGLDDDMLKAVAMVAEEFSFEAGDCFYEAEQPAGALYLLVQGEVENHLVVIDRDNPSLRKSFFLGDVDPGEVFGLSAMVEPYLHSTTTKATRPGSVIVMKAEALRGMAAENPTFGYFFTSQLLKFTLERLSDTRAELAAARP